MIVGYKWLLSFCILRCLPRCTSHNCSSNLVRCSASANTIPSSFRSTHFCTQQLPLSSPNYHSEPTESVHALVLNYNWYLLRFPLRVLWAILLGYFLWERLGCFLDNTGDSRKPLLERKINRKRERPDRHAHFFLGRAWLERRALITSLLAACAYMTPRWRGRSQWYIAQTQVQRNILFLCNCSSYEFRKRQCIHLVQ